MYAILTSPVFWEQIEHVVTLTGDEILFHKVAKDIDLCEELEKISRISIKVLIIDISSVPDQDKLTQAIMNYKIKREKTRIVIIAPNCTPGNATMSFLFSLGIWDFINPEGEKEEDLTVQESLNDCLKREPSYQKGVKWFTGPQDINGQVKTVKEKNKSESAIPERTVIIKQDKIIGTVVIAVAGSTNRIGTTSLAIAISQYLKNHKFKVALMELHDSKCFEHIKKAFVDVIDEGNMFKLRGVDFYPYASGTSILDLLQRQYKYIVLDMGIYGQCVKDEFIRANERIIVSGVRDWEIPDLYDILKADEHIRNNKYYFTLTNDADYKFVKKNMEDLLCFKAPYNTDPFNYNQDCSDAIYNMLKDILPGVKRKVKRKSIKEIFGLERREGNVSNDETISNINNEIQS